MAYMDENKANIAIAALASMTIIAMMLIGSSCSIQTSRIDGEQAASCLRSGGDWVKPPKVSEYSCAAKK